MPLTKKQRKEVWDKSGGVCWYCGHDLPEKGWHVDHFEPVIRETKLEWHAEERRYVSISGPLLRPELDTIENSVPSCAPCNLFKATFDVEFFRKELEAQIDRARKGSVNFRNAERFGLITINEAKITFWFEKQATNRG